MYIYLRVCVVRVYVFICVCNYPKTKNEKNSLLLFQQRKNCLYVEGSSAEVCLHSKIVLHKISKI